MKKFYNQLSIAKEKLVNEITPQKILLQKKLIY